MLKLEATSRPKPGATLTVAQPSATVRAFYATAGVTTLLLLILKLTGHIGVSWWIVFAPHLSAVALCSVLFVRAVRAGLAQMKKRGEI